MFNAIINSLVKKIIFLSCFIVFLSFFCFVFTPISSSDELDDITKQINDLSGALSMSVNATKPLESKLKEMQTQITQIKDRVGQIENDIAAKKVVIANGYKDLDKKQQILTQTIRNLYIKNSYNSPFLMLLSAKSASQTTEVMAYQKAAANQDKAIITNIVLAVSDLEEKKKQLESEQSRLIVLKSDLDDQSAKLDKVVLGAKTYQATLSSQIAQLSSKQQNLLAQKYATLSIPRSAGVAMGGCSDDRNIDPGFNPRFAFFSYGVPDRVGMSQWGAYGRAKAGQDYKTILNAYYNNVRFECRNFPNNTIKVDGYGDVALKDYLKGIGEMFTSWGDTGGYEALKAQVVASASFAYAYTGGGASQICTGQSCQVYLGHNKGGKWEQAVDEVNSSCGDGTQVMVSNDTNDVINAWYSTTFGGYTRTSGEVWGGQRPWTKNSADAAGSINSFSDLQNNAYDKESPWFYCDWGSRPSYNKTAWLKPSEVADIVNIILLAKADSSTREHFYQPDNPPAGTDTWNEDRVKSELRSRNITPFNNISSVSVSADFGGGKTTSVNFTGDAGSQSFNGSEFKDWFNLRAPANINIVGPLYNIETK